MKAAVFLPWNPAKWHLRLYLFEQRGRKPTPQVIDSSGDWALQTSFNKMRRQSESCLVLAKANVASHDAGLFLRYGSQRGQTALFPSAGEQIAYHSGLFPWSIQLCSRRDCVWPNTLQYISGSLEVIPRSSLIMMGPLRYFHLIRRLFG